jgi:gluconolactonase
MTWFERPKDVPTQVHSRLPEAFRTPCVTTWSRANKAGAAIDSFLEGPCFDWQGRLVVTDIPNGRIFRVGAAGAGDWEQIAQYDGWPNGLKVRRDGDYLVADYRRGLLRIDPAGGSVTEVLGTIRSESFKGLNDLCIAPDGAIYFTDQGQTGLQDPSGRVFRLTADGSLHCLIDTCPSPNGIVLDRTGKFLFVALTRACQVWRLPLTADAGVSKAQLFCQFPGGVSGPDGLAMDEEGGVLVANPGHGCVWRLDRHGVPTHRLVSCAGRTLTNLCFGGPGNALVFITDSETGQVLVAEAPFPGTS